MRALKVVIVLLALMAGLPTMAFAHAGHDHAASIAASPRSYAAISATETKTQAAKAFSHADRSDNPGLGDVAFKYLSSGTGIVLCTPGSCCCQGASSCGSGHCCAFGLSSTHAFGLNQREGKTARLALLDWPYPDLIFGLDRPPKF